jgi:CDP-diacylglycerol--glycerol-3-phosphate 3-phosphatidyltransferase
MPLRNQPLSRAYYRMLERRLLPKLNGAGLQPNQWTLIGLALAATVPVGFYVHPLLGLLCMGFSGVADTLDGLIARNTGAASRYGAFLDSSLDRVSDFFYLMGFWTLFWGQQRLIAASALFFAALLITEMISYLRARAEALGVSGHAGLMERGARVVYLLVWALLITVFSDFHGALLWSGLILYLVLVTVTVIQRMVHVRCRLTYGSSESGPSKL